MRPRIKKDANYVQGIVDYIKKNVQKGYSVDSLRWALINQGHSRLEVDKALSIARSEIIKETPLSQPKQMMQEAPTPSIEPPVEQKPSLWKRMFG